MMVDDELSHPCHPPSSFPIFSLITPISLLFQPCFKPTGAFVTHTKGKKLPKILQKFCIHSLNFSLNDLQKC